LIEKLAPARKHFEEVKEAREGLVKMRELLAQK